MATKRKTGMVGSEDLASSQVTERLTRTPGFKTIDDVTLEETSGGDQFTGETADEGDPVVFRPVGGTVDATDARDYPWVCRFSIFAVQDAAANVAQARADGAPADAVMKKSSGVWTTIDRVNPELRDELGKITLTTV